MRLILLATVAAACACSVLIAAEPKKQKSSDSRELQDLPATLRIKQRTTAAVPGSDGKLQLTTDDITRGQVTLSLSHVKHGVLLGPTSMRPEDVKAFQLGSQSYQLRLKDLDNALIGEDFAEVEIALPPDPGIEKRRVEKLIAGVEWMKDAAFIHGGREISPKEEADVLRALWKELAPETPTAEKFVARVEMSATFGGDPYLVRLSDKTVVPAGAYLLDRLRDERRKKEE